MNIKDKINNEVIIQSRYRYLIEALRTGDFKLTVNNAPSYILNGIETDFRECQEKALSVLEDLLLDKLEDSRRREKIFRTK